MSVFKVEANDTDFEEYYSIIVVCENKEKALEIAKKGNPWKYGLPLKEETNETYWEFDKSQYPLSVKEIDLNTEGVIDSSYRGS